MSGRLCEICQVPVWFVTGDRGCVFSGHLETIPKEDMYLGPTECGRNARAVTSFMGRDCSEAFYAVTCWRRLVGEVPDDRHKWMLPQD